MTQYECEKLVALAAVSAACKLTRRLQTELIINKTARKSDASPVTIADYAAQALIVSQLASKFPNDRFIAEESSKPLQKDKQLRKIIANQVNMSEDEMIQAIDRCSSDGKSSDFPGTRTWILDPIDGTKGFISFRQYCIALALLDDTGTTQLGILGCPNLPTKSMLEKDETNGVIFHAAYDNGCYMINDELNKESEELIQCSDVIDPIWAVVCESVETGHSSHALSARIMSILGISNAPVRMDSQAKYGCIARGDASVFLRFPKQNYIENVWDCAPAAIIVEEAGGKVTDGKGCDLDFSLGRKMNNQDGIVVSNGLFHNTIIQAVQEALKEEREEQILKETFN